VVVEKRREAGVIGEERGRVVLGGVVGAGREADRAVARVEAHVGDLVVGDHRLELRVRDRGGLRLEETWVEEVAHHEVEHDGDEDVDQH